MTPENFAVFTQILQHIARYFKWIVCASVALMLLSGVYRVESNEAAFVLRFGRLVGNTGAEQIKHPGIHFAFPFFIDEVVKIPVETVHEKEVLTHYGTSRGAIPADIEKSGYLLTGDNNLVLIRLTVKYKIKNAIHYRLYSCDVEKAIDGVLSAELTRAIMQVDIDSVLTSRKAKLSAEMEANSQILLDELKTGVLITDIELTEIVPSQEVKPYFEEVITASVNRETAIQHARERANYYATRAESESKALKQTAISDRALKLTKTHDYMAEFNGVYDQYVQDPQVVMNGTFRQRVTGILAKMGGSVIVPEGGRVPLIVLP